MPCRTLLIVCSSAIAMIGCDGDPTDIGGVTGVYTLVGMNGRGVPFPIAQDSLCATIYDGGFLELRANGRFLLVRDRIIDSPCGDEPRTVTAGGAMGAYGLSADTLRFDAEGEPDFIGLTSGDSVLVRLVPIDPRLEFTDTVSYVFLR
ncbi:MAG: hypothetical protein ACRELD_06395 [Longimicrobiales bacterium]